MAHRMLGFASSLTLEYYATHPDRYPSLGLTPVQVRRNYQSDLAVTTGNMSKRPYDNSRWPSRHTEAHGNTDGAHHRFEVGFGVLVSGDFVGGYECGAYGGMEHAAVFVDHGHSPPFLRAAFYRKGVKDVAAKAVAEMASFWEQHGHHESVWSRPIVEFRSDSGAFSSEATSAVCKELKITQTFSSPGAQGQNPAEASLRRVFETMTSCYANATWVPRTLWTYCLAYVCLCKNLKVVDLETGPSWEAFFATFYDFNSKPLLPFGQPVVVFIDKPQRTWKFGPHAFMAMYVGTPEGIKNAIMVFNPVTGRIRVTRDYMIVDTSAVPSYWKRYEAKDSTFQPVQHDPAYPLADEDHSLPLMLGDPMAEGTQEQQYNESIAVASNVPLTIEEVNGQYAPEQANVVGAAPITVVHTPAAVEQELNSMLIPVRDVLEGEDRQSVEEIIPEALDFAAEAVFIEEVDTEIPKEYYIRKVAGRRHATKSRWFSEALRIREVVRMAERRLRSIQGQVRRHGKVKIRNVDNPTLKKALEGPYRQMVLDAMSAELAQYTDTYAAIDIFTVDEENAMSKKDKKKAITTHFEITYKRDKKTGALEKVKARLVIHGDQEAKYEWDQIKSPTARSASVKLLMSILAKRMPGDRRFTGRAYDVPGAFLQSSIDESDAFKGQADPSFVPGPPIVIRLPDGRHGRLTVYAYGLKQASYEFYIRCKRVMTSLQFVSTSDPCLFVKWKGDDVIIAAVHVDDFFVVSTSIALHEELDEHFSRSFGQRLTRKSGDEIVYQGMVVQRRADGSVFVSQPSYVKDKVIEEWAFKTGWVNRAEVGVTDHPMQSTQLPRDGDDEPIDPTLYRGVVGAISYLAQMTRPDLLFCVSVAASHCQAPTVYDLRRVQRILKYIIGTAEYGLHFKSDSDFQVVAHADASFASRDLSRSQSGYCFSVGKDNAVFYARSTKQSFVTLSSTEAEYVALFHCSTEVIFLRRLMEELGFKQNPTVIFQDNQSTIHWAHGRDNFHRTKHMDIKLHYIRQLVSDATIEVVYLPTAQMIADVLTKPVLKEQFGWLSKRLLGVD